LLVIATPPVLDIVPELVMVAALISTAARLLVICRC
jgi:hypothetical protein